MHLRASFVDGDVLVASVSPVTEVTTDLLWHHQDPQIVVAPAKREMAADVRSLSLNQGSATDRSPARNPTGTEKPLAVIHLLGDVATEC